MDPKQVLHRYLSLQRDHLLAKLDGVGEREVRWPMTSTARQGTTNGNLPEQSAEEWATYRQRLEEAAETAHRAEARPQPSPESMSRPRMHLLEMRAVHEPENVAEGIQD